MHPLPRCLRLLAGLLFLVVPALAQQDWRWVNPLPAGISWKDAAFGNGVYVAVGGGGIATSPDGVTWTSVPQVRGLNAVEFGNGRFVAVGMGTPSSIGAALIMTSTNGTDWSTNTSVANSYNAQLMDVVYGGGLFVASGLSGAMLTSPDGLTWTQRGVAGVSAYTYRGTYGSGRFVFTISGGPNVATSTDGITWTRVATTGNAAANSPRYEAAAFAGGKFLLVGQSDAYTGAIALSTDGSTWTSGPNQAAVTNGFLGVAGLGSRFVAFGAKVFSSDDGLTWTDRSAGIPAVDRQMATAESASGVVAANGQFLLLRTYGSIFTSPDGAAWSLRSKGVLDTLGTVLRDGSRFLASGKGGTVLTSPDGSAWSRVATGTTSDLSFLVTNGTRWVAAGTDGIFHSTNLTSWTQVAGTSYFTPMAAAAFGNGRFVAAHDTLGLGVRTSADGVTWGTSTIAGEQGTTGGLVFGSGVFVLINKIYGSVTPKIYSSTDGSAWVNRAPAGLPAGTAFESVAAGGGRFVVLTGNQRSLTSTDGITWTLNSQPVGISLAAVKYAGGRFLARSSESGYPLYGSTDGVSWIKVEGSEMATPCNDLLVAGEFALAVGSNGMILKGSVPAAGRLVNMSIRTNAGTDADLLIVGVALGGANTAGSKPVLVRGAGPTLGAFGVAGALADPVMTVFAGQTQIGRNDDWDATAGARFAEVGAFPFPAGSKDAALYSAVPPGSYSVQIAGANGGTGIALAEVYDATPAASFTAATPRLVNVSARARVGTGADLLIAGFVVAGQSPVRVLIRASGPALAAFGLSGTLADPRLEVFNGSTKVAENDNWDATAGAAFAGVGAFNFAAGSKDAALVVTLAPGNYSAQVSGVGDTTGLGLVEVYELP